MEEILQLLSDDARLSATQIAERVGRPVAEVQEIIAKLEKDRVIRRYKTVVDWERIGVEHVFGFIEVRCAPQRGVGFDAVAERIMEFPEVHSLYLMSGAYDFLVVIQGKSMRDVAYFVAEKLAPLEHVVGTATHFVLKRYKVDGDIMVDRSETKRLPVTP
jgi:DNA-binding Lrp family transcriptional regulator